MAPSKYKRLKKNVWAKIDFDGFLVNIEIDEIIFASYVVGVLLDLW